MDGRRGAGQAVRDADCGAARSVCEGGAQPAAEYRGSRGSGDLVTRASDDIAQISTTLPHVLPRAAVSAFTIVLVATGLGAMNLWFLVGWALTIPGYVLTVVWYLRTALSRIWRAIGWRSRGVGSAFWGRSRRCRRYLRTGSKLALLGRSKVPRGKLCDGRCAPVSSRIGSSGGST